MKRVWLGLVSALAIGLVIAYGVRRAHAYDIPTSNTLTYTGTLYTFGQLDNSMHSISLALYVTGATSSSCNTIATSIQVTNGQFSVPLPSACVTTIHQNPSVEVLVTIDGVAMGLEPLAAVPYAVEADTASYAAPGSTLATQISAAASASAGKYVVQDSSTGEASLPVGSTGQRTTSPTAGMLRYNSTTGTLEAYVPAGWTPVVTSPAIPVSCAAILAANASAASAEYEIQPPGFAPMEVWCDMTDDNGGYTQIWENEFEGNDGAPTFTQAQIPGYASQLITALGATSMLLTETISGATTWLRVNSLTPTVYFNWWTGVGGTYNVTTIGGANFTNINGHPLRTTGVNQFANGTASVDTDTIFEFQTWTNPGRDTNHYWHIWPAGNGAYAAASGVGGLRLGAIYIK